MTVRAILPAVAGLALLWLAMLLLGAGDVDREILLALYARDEPLLALVALGFTFFGDWWTAVAVALLGSAWLLYRGRRPEALLLLVTTFTGRALVILEKAYFSRIRPEEHMHLVDVSSMSFPSGHSANSMMVHLSLALLAFDDDRRRKPAVAAALALTFLVGLSRPMLGVHWPSDVIGGWSFGALWTLSLITIGQRLRERRKPARA